MEFWEEVPISIDLDAAARNNLSPELLADYEEYKARLIAYGVGREEMDEVLRGLIWEGIELGEESNKPE